jgi:hypothetical protein
VAGERDLGRLLAGLDPVLHDELLVYATLPPGSALPAVDVVVQVAEREGTTLVVPAADAQRLGLRHEFPCRRIELRVGSDLEAVGLTAAVAGALASEGIAANVVAGFFHDHVLVPTDRGAEARDVLVDLTTAATLRPAVADDEDALWRMLRSASWATDDEDERTDPYLRRYVEGWGRPGDVGVVAVGRSGRVVGAVSARPVVDDVPEVMIGCTPSQRGRGVGAALLAALDDAAAAAGYGLLRLDVRAENPARRLYERHGWIPIGRTVNRVGGSSVVMERRLPSR